MGGYEVSPEFAKRWPKGTLVRVLHHNVLTESTPGNKEKIESDFGSGVYATSGVECTDVERVKVKPTKENPFVGEWYLLPEWLEVVDPEDGLNVRANVDKAVEDFRATLDKALDDAVGSFRETLNRSLNVK